MVLKENLENKILRKFSNLKKLTVVIANCLRFIHNAKGKNKRIGKLSTDEYNNAFQRVIRMTQAEAFPRKIHLLSN